MNVSVNERLDIYKEDMAELKVDKRKLMGWMIAMLVPLMIGLVPLSVDFTSSLKTFFMVTLFVILIIAFELLPVLISAILLPTLYLLSGLVSSEIAFASWTNTTVWMVLGGLTLSYVLEECGLLRRIAYYVIRKCGGTYKGAVFGCFSIGIILNLITFSHGWIVNSVLVYGICKAMDLKPSREASLVCFAGIAAGTGGTVFLYNPGYAAMIETALRNFTPDYSMSIFTPFIYNGLFALWCLIAIFILMKVYKIDEIDFNISKGIFDEKYEQLGSMTSKEKKAVAIVTILMIYLCATQFTGWSVAYGFMTIPYLLFFPGVDVGNTNAISKMNFSTVFFVATCLGIGLVGAHIGLGEFIANIVVPLLEGKSPLVICIVFMAVGAIANLFMTPYAMLGGLSATFAQIAASLGINPIVALMILMYSCDMVFLPYQSTGNLIMYSYGLMPMKDFIKQQFLKSLIMFLGFILVMYPMWNIFGLM